MFAFPDMQHLTHRRVDPNLSNLSYAHVMNETKTLIMCLQVCKYVRKYVTDTVTY